MPLTTAGNLLENFYRVMACPDCRGWGFDTNTGEHCEPCAGSGIKQEVRKRSTPHDNKIGEKR